MIGKRNEGVAEGVDQVRSDLARRVGGGVGGGGGKAEFFKGFEEGTTFSFEVNNG